MPDLYETKDQFDGLEWEEYTYRPANADDLVDTHVLVEEPIMMVNDDGDEVPMMETAENGTEKEVTRTVEKVKALPLMEAKGISEGPYLAAQVPFEWRYKLPGRNEVQAVVAGGYALVYDEDNHVKGVAQARFERDYTKVS